MKAFKKKEGYVTKGNRKIQEGRTPEAMQVVLDGLNDYQNRILDAINGYPTSDAALLIASLRTLADDIEEQNPDCKALLKWIDQSVKKPKFQTTEKMKKTKCR